MMISKEQQLSLLKLPYVADGLAGFWDATWNIGWNESDEGAGIVKDLTGNSLPKQLTIGKDFDGNNAILIGNEVVQFPKAADSKIATKEATFEIYASIGIIQREINSSIMMFNNSVWTVGWHLYPGNGNDLYFRGGTYKIHPIDNKIKFQSAITIKLLDDAGKQFQGFAYVNGKLVQTISGNLSQNIYDCIFNVGTVNNSDATIRDLRICSLRLYDRALTAAEVEANWLTDKERFMI